MSFKTIYKCPTANPANCYEILTPVIISYPKIAKGKYPPKLNILNLKI